MNKVNGEWYTVKGVRYGEAPFTVNHVPFTK
jgi:hypothetical protein